MKKDTVVYFETEEAFFQKYSFEVFAEHKAEHQKFVDKVVDSETVLERTTDFIILKS
ncbi:MULTISPECIES: hypothetical protein [unclassified Saccharicrinis]|uniref:hypothetical protein n=1 Tax=unclassified Saccharicrinis TaxID=2646859 RepID=UPI003D34BD0D